MMIEQIGSAIFQPKNLMSNDDIITPTLPEKLEIKFIFLVLIIQQIMLEILANFNKKILMIKNRNFT